MDHEASGPEDQRSRGQKDQGTKGLGDKRTETNRLGDLLNYLCDPVIAYPVIIFLLLLSMSFDYCIII